MVLLKNIIIQFKTFRSCTRKMFIILDLILLAVLIALKYASDLCPPCISCSFAADSILYQTKCFSRDKLESLQHILDDAVENIIVSPPETESVCLLRMTLIVLCLVKYLSARHVKCVTFQYENNCPQQLYCITSLHPLGYLLATSVLRT